MQDCHAIWSEGFDWGQDFLRSETNIVGFGLGECSHNPVSNKILTESDFNAIGVVQTEGSISIIDSTVTGSAGAGLLVVDAPGPTVLFSGVVLRNVARFDTGQNKGQHATPIHLIDSIGGEA